LGSSVCPSRSLRIGCPSSSRFTTPNIMATPAW
jgi:hypothetical protein